ncbi:hypothetical protein HIM_07298 [Hirsutella minnesotensis 3608]|uniref:Uncharacterized protein n=1 Tax=Hirsutella minnesotensis 3608 TaxID=1043627 RepID=A0A0F8A4B6_9HYPO|nr:hypothetical protein HIM_07298 [Hirsutella minnesotensis 3608]
MYRGLFLSSLGVVGLGSRLGAADPDVSPPSDALLFQNSNSVADCKAACAATIGVKAYEPINIEVDCNIVNRYENSNWLDTKPADLKNELEEQLGEEIDDEELPHLRALREWEKLGCKRRAECEKSQDVKKCCDDRWYLPFELGPLYNGYLAACAPGHLMKREDVPQHRELSCPTLLGRNPQPDPEEWRVVSEMMQGEPPSFIDVRVIALRQIETEACRQGMKCKAEANGDANCCQQHAPNGPTSDKDPDRPMFDLFKARYLKRCEEGLTLQ